MGRRGTSGPLEAERADSFEPASGPVEFPDPARPEAVPQIALEAGPRPEHTPPPAVELERRLAATGENLGEYLRKRTVGAVAYELEQAAERPVVQGVEQGVERKRGLATIEEWCAQEPTGLMRREGRALARNGVGRTRPTPDQREKAQELPALLDGGDAQPGDAAPVLPERKQEAFFVEKGFGSSARFARSIQRGRRARTCSIRSSNRTRIPWEGDTRSPVDPARGPHRSRFGCMVGPLSGRGELVVPLPR